MNILDCGNGTANNMLAAINGARHKVNIETSDTAFIPEPFNIELSARNRHV
jgi:hypothetical protein